MALMDELNVLKTKKRAIPFRQYFEEMDMDEEQIEKRVEHSEKLSPILFFIINLVIIYFEYGRTDYENIVEELRNNYIEILGEQGVDIDPNVIDYIERFSQDFVDTTVKKVKELDEAGEDIEPGKDFLISDDRADVVAENEANVIYNFEDFKDAVKEGKKFKVWVTERDNKVRKTHTVVDGQTIPIDEYFSVGNSYLLYPKDMSLDPEVEETANCRCKCIYI